MPGLPPIGIPIPGAPIGIPMGGPPIGIPPGPACPGPSGSGAYPGAGAPAPIAPGSGGAATVGTTVAGPAGLDVTNEMPGWPCWAEAQAALSRTPISDRTVLRILHLDNRGPRNRVARVSTISTSPGLQSGSACKRSPASASHRAGRTSPRRSTGETSGRAGVPALYRTGAVIKWKRFADLVERDG